jgi:serine/threonine protein kinase
MVDMEEAYDLEAYLSHLYRHSGLPPDAPASASAEAGGGCGVPLCGTSHLDEAVAKAARCSGITNVSTGVSLLPDNGASSESLPETLPETPSLKEGHRRSMIRSDTDFDSPRRAASPGGRTFRAARPGGSLQKKRGLTLTEISPVISDAQKSASDMSTWYPVTPYECGELLGAGSSSKVFAAREVRTGADVAVKLPYQCSEEIAMLMKAEYERVRGLHHPNIVRIVDFSVAPLYVVMGILRGPSLECLVTAQRQRCLPEALACTYARQLTAGLAYMHSKDVVHRDVKPENVQIVGRGPLDLRRAVLTDFNVCTGRWDSADSADGNTSSCLLTVTGTPAYRAPEVEREWAYDHKVDVWGLGLSAHFMLRGRPPLFEFHSSLPDFELRAATRSWFLLGDGTFARCLLDPAVFSPASRAFVAACLEVIAVLRPDAVELSRHDWFLSEAKRGCQRRTRSLPTALTRRRPMKRALTYRVREES